MSFEEGENFKKTHNIHLFFETSAKSGKNVKMVYQIIYLFFKLLISNIKTNNNFFLFMYKIVININI